MGPRGPTYAVGLREEKGELGQWLLLGLRGEKGELGQEGREASWAPQSNEAKAQVESYAGRVKEGRGKGAGPNWGMERKRYFPFYFKEFQRDRKGIWDEFQRRLEMEI